MWSRLGASSPVGGASSRVRMSSWIMAAARRRACDRSAQVSGLRPSLAWAAWTIFRRRQAHLLDSLRSRSKNGIRLTRRHLALLLVFAALAAPVAATAQATPLEARLAEALRVPHVAPGRSAAIALDLTSGELLYSQNPALPLAPASNEKLPLTYAALATLGATYRIETDVLGEGEQAGTTFDGTLVLKGSGDPTLSTAGLRSLAAQVRAYGIRRVTDGIVGDETWFDARRTVTGWKPRFFIEESPPLSALIVDRARVGRYVTRAPALAAAATFRDALRAAGVAVEGTTRLGRVDDF